MRVARHWNKLSGDDAGAASLDVFRVRLDGLRAARSA